MKNLKIWKRITSVILTVCLVLGCLVGCNNSNDETTKAPQTDAGTEPSGTEEGTKEPVTEAPKDPVKLTYYGQLLGASNTLTNLGDMEIMKIADEKCNTIVTYVHPSIGAEKEDFNLKMTNRQYEDIMEYNWTSYAGGPSLAIDDEVIIDLAPYLEQGYAPNYKKFLDEHPEIAKQVTTDKGEIFAFACIGDKSVNVTFGYYVREDFLKKAGLDAPVTIADWEEMLTKFKEMGIQSPLTGRGTNLIGGGNSWLTGAFSTYSGFYVRDGKVKYGFLDEGYKEYITTMARWFKEGLLDQNIFGNNEKAATSQILNDKAAVMVGYIGSAIGTLTNNAKANENSNPDFKLMGLQFPVKNEGDEPEFMKRSEDARTANMAAVSTSCKDVEAAMKYLDFWYSEEGHMLKNFGVENLTYTLVNGEPVYTDLILKNPDGLSIGDALGKYTRASNPTVGIIDMRYYEQYYQLEEQVEAMYTWNKYADNAVAVLMPTVTPTDDEAEELAVIKSSVNSYISQELTKFIMGNRNLSEWDSFISTLKEMNVDRMIEINQAAYDRYMAR